MQVLCGNGRTGFKADVGKEDSGSRDRGSEQDHGYQIGGPGRESTRSSRLNLTDGRLIFCQAQSIILANGSAARFGLPNTGYLYGTFDFPGNAGDGFSLAFRAGARITGMEFTLKYTLVKDLNIPLILHCHYQGWAGHQCCRGDHVDENNLSVFRLREALKKTGPFYLKTDHLPKEKSWKWKVFCSVRKDPCSAGTGS